MLIIPQNHPLPEGEAEIFWEMACGIELESFNGYFSYVKAVGIFPSQGDQYFFNQQKQRVEYYWTLIVFEALFLPLWWLFTFHPGLFGQWQKNALHG